uniref:Uncharacterized protein n=1 Tax=Tetraselmis sp. GSL018 TaxID=582737 RepID=A0A061RN13_9CHLO
MKTKHTNTSGYQIQSAKRYDFLENFVGLSAKKIMFNQRIGRCRAQKGKGRPSSWKSNLKATSTHNNA